MAVETADSLHPYFVSVNTISRRKFLPLLGLAAISPFILASCDSSLNKDIKRSSEFGKFPSSDWDESVAFMKYMLDFQIKLPKPNYATSSAWMDQRVAVLISEYKSSQIVKDPVVVGKIEYVKMPTNADQVEELAIASCFDNKLYMNQRFVDEQSPWSKEPPGNLFLLAHELYHFQSLCARYSVVNMEASAQIAALSTLALLSDDNYLSEMIKREARRGFVEALVKFTRGYLLYEAIKDPSRTESYITITHSLLGYDEKEARNQILRYGEQGVEKFEGSEGLYSDEVRPYILLVKGIRQGFLVEGEILIPANHDQRVLKAQLDARNDPRPLALPTKSQLGGYKRFSVDPIVKTLKGLGA